MSKKKKILWIIQRPYTPQTGGASRRIQELAWTMQKKFHWDVYIVTSETNFFTEDTNHKGINIFVVKRSQNRFNSLVFVIKFLWQVITHRSTKQVVHINAPRLFDGLLIRLLNFMGIRTVIQLTLEGRDDPFSLEASTSYKKFIKKFLMSGLASAKAILCMSPSLVSLCLKYGWNKNKVVWTPHAKDTSIFRPAQSKEEIDSIREEFGLPINKILVGFLGFVGPRKGFPEFVYAWEKANLDTSGFLAIAGPISVRNKENTLKILSTKGTSIKYLGILKRMEVAKYLRCLDLFLLPSKREGFSGALVEALLSGIPCLTTCLPGVTDVVINNWINGILIPPNDQNALEKALIKFLKSYEFRRKLVKNTNDLIEVFNDEKVYLAYNNLYNTGNINDFQNLGLNSQLPQNG